MHNLFFKNEPAEIIHPPFILADLKNMALILQHYWQSVNTCPKAIAARGTQTAVKYVSVGFSPQKRCTQPFQVMHGLWLPSREMTSWLSQGMTTDHHSTPARKVTAGKRLQLVSLSVGSLAKMQNFTSSTTLHPGTSSSRMLSEWGRAILS